MLEENFAEIDAALASFVAEMEAQGRWGDVAVLSVSEFGRTITSNGAGTDHGWGGNHFVLGGAVKGGQVFGQYPDDLSDDGPLSTGRGRIIPTTPWDGVWAPMAEWLGVEAGSMAEVLPNGAPPCRRDPSCSSAHPRSPQPAAAILWVVCARLLRRARGARALLHSGQLRAGHAPHPRG